MCNLPFIPLICFHTALSTRVVYAQLLITSSSVSKRLRSFFKCCSYAVFIIFAFKASWILCLNKMSLYSALAYLMILGICHETRGSYYRQRWRCGRRRNRTSEMLKCRRSLLHVIYLIFSFIYFNHYLYCSYAVSYASLAAAWLSFCASALSSLRFNYN